MKPPQLVITMAVLLSLLGSAGCTTNGTSYSKSCQMFVCRIKATGEQDVDLTFGERTHTLRIGPIEPGAVSLSMGSDRARLAPGDSAPLDGMAVVLVSLAGRDVQLLVRPR